MIVMSVDAPLETIVSLTEIVYYSHALTEPYMTNALKLNLYSVMMEI